MYKKIMVAIDDKNTSHGALREAENIANSYNGTVCIVHAVSSDSSDNQSATDLLAQAETSIDVLSIETQLITAAAEYGSEGISAAIAAAAGEWGADLVVVGTANRRGLDSFVMGSVAERLVSKVKSSILLVRPE